MSRSSTPRGSRWPSASIARTLRAPLMEAIVRTAAGVFEAAASSISLKDRTTGELVYQSAWGAGAHEIVGVRLPPGKGFAGMVIESGQAEACDCRNDPRFAAQIAAGTGYVPYTMLVVPLRGKPGDRSAVGARPSRWPQLPRGRHRTGSAVRQPDRQGAQRHAWIIHQPRDHELTSPSCR